jgi:hypothetical protein
MYATVNIRSENDEKKLTKAIFENLDDAIKYANEYEGYIEVYKIKLNGELVFDETDVLYTNKYFRYDNCIDRSRYDKFVESIKFPTNRDETNHHTISFDEPVNIYEAIQKVETYLNMPLDEEYYNKNFHKWVPTYKEALKHNWNKRGDCLDSLIYLERIYKDTCGNVELYFGS